MKKAAVIGLGDVSSIHLSAIAANEEISLCAVCDIDSAARERAPKGVPFYTDFKEMIEKERPDCVHICLPHYLHYPVAAKAADMGVHVFCEKPVALNQKEAEAFVRVEKEHPALQIGICLQNRLNETTEALKERIDSRAYGKVTGIRGIVPWFRPREYYETKPWRGKWKTAGGGCMINQSIHTLDLMYYLAGPVTRLRASVSQMLDYGIEVEDTVTASLAFENGARGLFYATNANFKNEAVQLAVEMESGCFIMRNNVLYQRKEDGTEAKIVEDRKLPGTKFYYGASHEKLIRRFYHSLETGDGNYIRVEDAVMSIRLIDAIQNSGRFGIWTEV
ncbi:MAG: Gfo/Idh/MocA family oxidoreductase [Eubacteriales bacterium]|nr:Gfo/Idh/MocA family oxidoreductase [Eubacteriales bacterium]